MRHVHDMFGVDRVDLVGVTCGMYTICLEWIDWTWCVGVTCGMYTICLEWIEWTW